MVGPEQRLTGPSPNPQSSPQCIGNSLQSLKADVALPTLNLPYVGSMKSGFIRKDILRPSLPLSQCSNFGPHLFLDVLHQEQFGAGLVLAITGFNQQCPDCQTWDLLPRPILA